MIDNFHRTRDGRSFSFLSNMFAYPIKYKGIIYTCSEAAYQAAKSLDPAVAEEFSSLNGLEAKHRGRQLKVREDWDEVKLSVMHDILQEKFSREEMISLLLSTGTEELIEGNTWHDNYWGNCTCEDCVSIQGQNHLGILLMERRAELIRIMSE